jgi:hypothetical protein
MGLTQITTGGVDDNINIDSNTLKVDGTNNRVGVNTAAPDYALHAVGTIAARDSGTNTDIRLIPGSQQGSYSINANTAQHIFVSGANERMRIDSSGNLNLVSSSSTLTDLNFTASDLTVYARVEGGKSGSGVGDLRFHTYSGGLSEAMRIDSSGNVGINNTSPGSQVFNDLVIGDGSGDHGLTIHTGASSSGSIGFSDGTSGADRFDGYLQYDHSNQSFKIYTNGGNERMRIDSSGRIGIATTSPGATLDARGAVRLGNQANGDGTTVIKTSNGVYIGTNDGTTTTTVVPLQIGGYPAASGYSATPDHAIVLDGWSGSTIYHNAIVNRKGRDLSFHTAITGNGFSDTNERMRIDSSGDVMIGTTSNNAHANSDNLIIGSTSGSYNGLTINASSGSQIRFADAANNSIGYVIYNHGSNKLEFGCNGAEGFIVTQNRFIQTGGYTNNSAQYHRINGRDQTQGTTFAVFSGYQTSGGSSGDTAYFYSCNTGTGPNGAATAFSVFRNALTSRSINAAGTINASGADYAEYMTKAGNFALAKGDICGINSEGKLTNVFADAISFVVKSTDPSYVGGDTWHTAAGEKPGGAGDDRTQEEIAAATVVYEEALEAARQLVDRIAFSGQVPVNVTGATPGQHIIPTAAADGSIEGTAKAEADLTMSEYMSSVGKVIAVGDDGRAKIIVKVA